MPVLQSIAHRLAQKKLSLKNLKKLIYLNIQICPVVSIDLFSPSNCSFSYNGVYKVVFKLSTSDVIGCQKCEETEC